MSICTVHKINKVNPILYYRCLKGTTDRIDVLTKSCVISVIIDIETDPLIEADISYLKAGNCMNTD